MVIESINVDCRNRRRASVLTGSVEVLDQGCEVLLSIPGHTEMCLLPVEAPTAV